MILAGDIGGTHARLALMADGSTEPLRERRYLCADHAGVEPLLADFLAGETRPVRAGCLAVAGPIADDGRSARLTNLPWIIEADALAARFGIGRLTLANDFTAAALGITACPAETLVPLQAGEPLAAAPRLVVGAGTGLGMAVLLPAAQGWQVLPGEGGHVAFGPIDTDQAGLWHEFYRRHGRVTAERVISGPGLEAIHQHLAPGAPPVSAELISTQATADPAGTAGRAIAMFLAAYGAYAGDMAMAVMARGGVYLAGGIAAKLLPLLAASPFLAAFNAKAEHAALIRRMPVIVAIDPALGLRGAALLAARSPS
jgi:glucokinase